MDCRWFQIPVLCFENILTRGATLQDSMPGIKPGAKDGGFLIRLIPWTGPRRGFMARFDHLPMAKPGSSAGCMQAAQSREVNPAVGQLMEDRSGYNNAHPTGGQDSPTCG